MQNPPRFSKLRRDRVATVRLYCRRLSFAVFLLIASPAHADPPALPSPSPEPKPTVTPTPKVEPSPKPTREHRAPPGVLYLVEDTTVPLKDGLEGLVAGSPVKLVKVIGDSVLVASGDHEFTVKKTQVTDDLDIVAVVQRRAAAIEAADEASLQQQESVLVKQQREQIEFLRTHPLATPTPTPKK